jgi:hypothetical protein
VGLSKNESSSIIVTGEVLDENSNLIYVDFKK